MNIPESHQDLLEKPIVVTVATISPDGTPHSAVVWRIYEDGYILFTSDYGSRKYKNMLANPNVSILAIDPQNSGRYLEIGGVVEDVREEGAEALLDRLAKFYQGKERFFGDVEPVENRSKYRTFVFKVRPTRASKFG